MNQKNTKQKDCNNKNYNIKDNASEDPIYEFVKKNHERVQKELSRKILSGEIKVSYKTE